MNCPKCAIEMVVGYSVANQPLSWIEKKQFDSYIFTSVDLAKAGIRSMLPWKAWYFIAFHCPRCKIITVDYAKKYDRKSIENFIKLN